SPPPVVYSRCVDDSLREVVKKLRERTNMYKERAIDPYATSPEISPPVSKWTPVMFCQLVISKFPSFPSFQSNTQCVHFNRCRGLIFRVMKYIAWLTVVSVAFNYNIWFTPVRLVFPIHTPVTIPFWIIVDIIVDIVNVIDVVLWQPRLQFVKGGDIIADLFRVQILNSSVHCLFFLLGQMDMISIIPFDLLGVLFGFSAVFRLNRLLRIESFFEFSDRLESIMAKAYIWRVGRTTGYLLFMLHLNACFYYMASEYLGINSSKWVYNGQGTAYLRCYYFAVRSLINIGGLPEPGSVFEICFQMTNFFVGVFVFSSLIGQMRDVIGAATQGQTYFRASMDGCVAYMNMFYIPDLVQNRVRTWYNYTWDAQGMLDESELLETMPLVMRTAIGVDINFATFDKIALFQGCDKQMLVDMLLRLKSIIYLPGDFVVKKGDIGKEMYIIKGGEVQVVGGPDNSIVFVTLKAGCVFGEISLLQSAKDGGNRRTANVKAHGFVNLFVLDKKDLVEILVHYPNSQKVLAKKGRKLMKAKGPAAAKAEEDKKKGLALFGPKPPTPKLARVFGGFGKGGFLEKLKVQFSNSILFFSHNRFIWQKATYTIEISDRGSCFSPTFLQAAQAKENTGNK
uniref:Cyclic nucleotide-binding domain-containing protein n=1 Tax=Esox lucius TaxID=8010 RepID=A0A3P8XAM5_ESOLU